MIELLLSSGFIASFIASFIVIFLCIKKTCKNIYGIGVLRGYIYGYKSAIRKCPIENPDELLKKLSIKTIREDVKK